MEAAGLASCSRSLRELQGEIGLDAWNMGDHSGLERYKYEARNSLRLSIRSSSRASSPGHRSLCDDVALSSEHLASLRDVCSSSRSPCHLTPSCF